MVYTPPDVARAMTRLVLAPLVEAAASRDILALRICDPAAGAGVFLLEVVAYLAEHLVAAWHRERAPSPADETAATWAREARSLVARTCIVGIDIDEVALHTAARSLGIESTEYIAVRSLGVDAASTAPATPSNVGSSRGSGSHAARPTTSLLHADALALDWRATFPDVFESGGFDVVLANPPYVRQESLAAKSRLDSFAVYDGVADLYVYFLELAHRLLRPRGRYCVIVPSKWMTAEYGRPLRSFLAAAYTVDGVADLSTHELFDDADAFPCIVWGTLGASRDRDVIGVRARAHDDIDEVLRAAIAVSGEAQPFAFSGDSELTARATTTAREALSGAVPARIARERWRADPWNIDSSSERALLDRFEHAYPTLGEVIGTRWSRGVVTGLNEAFVIDRTARAALIASDPTCEVWVRPFLRGRDLRPYIPRSGDRLDHERWLLLVDRGTPYDALPAPLRDHLMRFRERLEPRPADHEGAWLGRKPGAYAWHELQDPVVPLARSRSPRCFYQDIQTSPACSFDPDGVLVPDTTVWILPSSDLYLLAILNSRLYHWYARRRFPPALNGAVRPKLAYMQRLPIPTPSRDLRREIEALVERRLAASRDMSSESTRDTTTIDSQIERMIELAYELSSIERALVAT